MTVNDAIKSTRKELKLSVLYGRIIDGKVNEHDKWIIATIIKRLGTSESRDILIFSETHYVDLAKKEEGFEF